MSFEPCCKIKGGAHPFFLSVSFFGLLYFVGSLQPLVGGFLVVRQVA